MPDSMTLKLIVRYDRGFFYDPDRPPDRPLEENEIDFEPVDEQPDDNGYYYLGLNAFQSELSESDSILKTLIKVRNGDVDDINYLGPIPDSMGFKSHQFEVVITLEPNSPFQSLTDYVNEEGTIIWPTVFNELYKGSLGLLDRIFWIPPSGPRILGIFWIMGGILTIGSQIYMILIDEPWTGGGGGGGMK